MSEYNIAIKTARWSEFAMPWRSSTTMQERVLAFLPYLLPLLQVIVSALGLLGLLFQNYFSNNEGIAIAVVALSTTILPWVGWLNSFAVSLLLFLGLYLLVVRNEKIPHFIRFNTMQALLIEIALALFGYVSTLFAPIAGMSLIFTLLSSFLVVGVVALVVFAFVQCLRGVYADIPAISDAAYSQVR
jgi:uncharacterized membrane protein